MSDALRTIYWRAWHDNYTATASELQAAVAAVEAVAEEGARRERKRLEAAGCANPAMALAIKDTNEYLKQQLSEANDKLERRNSHNVLLQNVITERNATIRELRSENESLDRRLAWVDADSRQFQGRIEQLEKELADWKCRVVGHVDGACKIVSQGDECDCPLCSRDKRIDELEQQLTEAENRADEIKERADADWEANRKELKAMTDYRDAAANAHAELADRLWEYVTKHGIGKPGSEMLSELFDECDRLRQQLTAANAECKEIHNDLDELQQRYTATEVDDDDGLAKAIHKVYENADAFCGWKDSLFCDMSRNAADAAREYLEASGWTPPVAGKG